MQNYRHSDRGQPSGWRKTTPALVHVEHLADAGKQATINKSRASLAVKRAAPHFGLKPGDIVLLDTLFAFSKDQDWIEGQRPIVWPSNNFLMEQTSFSRSALKRHIRRLAEFGLISFKDSSNGKRWGRRDEEGKIVEAYGFDLSPMAVRTAELEALHVEMRNERAICSQLKRQITIARRMIRAHLEAAQNSVLWKRLRRAFELLLTTLPKSKADSEMLRAVLKQLEDLLCRVQKAYESKLREVPSSKAAEYREGASASKQPKTDPLGSSSEPHILTTNEPGYVTRNLQRIGKSSERAIFSQGVETSDLDEWVAEKRREHSTTIDLSVVMQSCPEFTGWVRTLNVFVEDWSDLHRAAGLLRPMIGVSEQAWNSAQETLGPQRAAIALALVFDKHSAGEVSSPGGYLRGMVEKAALGKLHLERSLFGRLANAA